MTNEQTTPDPIMQLGLAFWESKALLTAVELGVFTALAHGGATEGCVPVQLALRHPHLTGGGFDRRHQLPPSARLRDPEARSSASWCDLAVIREQPGCTIG